MKGKYHIVIQNRKLRYEFDIKRNITIIKGDSATGKTTLVNMIRQFSILGKSSGIQISCDVECQVLEGKQWKVILQTMSEQILFIDEENAFIKSDEFAREVQHSDNYFVIVTRENLYNLPYSIEEIYGIHSSGKYQMTERVYQDFYRIYPNNIEMPFAPELIITEDSQAGFEFFSEIARRKGIDCKSAGSKTKLLSLLQHCPHGTRVCVIADGAALGAEMGRLYDFASATNLICLYLPESFEWLLLNSGLVENPELKNILQYPENYIDSKIYFSWERFFTYYLCECTRDTYLQYSKSFLNPAYLQNKIIKNIMANIDKNILI